MEPTRASVLSSNFVLLFQIIVNQKEPDHPSFYIDIRSKGTFLSKKEPIGKVWYIAKRQKDKKQKDKKQKDRKMKRQKDRKTKRQKDKKT